VIDLGPEGGEHGGDVVAADTPEALARTEDSHTGRYLRDLLPAVDAEGPRSDRVVAADAEDDAGDEEAEADSAPATATDD
jgi:excinuclease ABC subunit A